MQSSKFKLNLARVCVLAPSDVEGQPNYSHCNQVVREGIFVQCRFLQCWSPFCPLG